MESSPQNILFGCFSSKMNGASQEELSSFLMIDKASTARAIESLANKGYVVKERDSRDKRANRVFLTQQSADLQNRFQ